MPRGLAALTGFWHTHCALVERRASGRANRRWRVGVEVDGRGGAGRAGDQVYRRWVSLRRAPPCSAVLRRAPPCSAVPPTACSSRSPWLPWHAHGTPALERSSAEPSTPRGGPEDRCWRPGTPWTCFHPRSL